MPIINAAGLDLIKNFEGCVLTAYLDAVGVPTIGWGHTLDVQMGQTITQAQADNFLAMDLHASEAVVNNAVSHNLTPNQFAALVSFEFNTGALTESTLMRMVNAGDIQGAAGQFGRWVYGNGQVLPGLVRRRKAERTLFLTP